MKRVAVGRTPGGFKQAVGIRTSSEWCRPSINRTELVRISGRQLVQADEEAEALTSGRTGGMGEVDLACSSGHGLEETSEGATEGDGEGSIENGRGKVQE